MMFRKLHIQLTLLFTVITGLVLTAMSAVCLFISENDAREISYTTFQNNINSILDYLENQPTLSHQWIREAEQRYGIYLDIRDNGSPLFFYTLQSGRPDTALFDLARQSAEDTLAVTTESSYNQSTATHSEFQLDAGKQGDYYASIATIPRGNGSLQITSLYPEYTLLQQFYHQRVLFALATAAGICVLALFSWLYTHRLLQPLIQNQKNQTEFIAAASHELRSPLAVILSSLSALRVADTAEAPRFYQSIESEGQRMSHLIEDMLSLANADNHTWQIHQTSAALDTLLLEAYEKYEPMAKEKNISLGITLPEDAVPPCLCDPSRISQVLAVLIDNALSYTPSGGSIRLSLDSHRDFLQISIADDGPGIPDAQKEAIFQRFYRGDASHKDREHFGLGLCIAREILRLHHGEISVRDTPGGGATFLVRLPYHSGH